MQELLHHHILDVEIAHDTDEGRQTGLDGALRFTTKDGYLIYTTEDDCCSETWFSEIINLDFLINQTVNEVVELDMPEYIDGNCRQDFDKFYGYRLTTSKGHCTIAFRNSSNGYYGGSCSLNDQVKIENWCSIKHLADWTAYEKTDGSYLRYYKLKAFW